MNFEEVRDIIKKEWAETQEGSSAYTLQRKIQNSLRKIRSWCLEYKKRNHIDWQDINGKLIDYQKNITSCSQVDSEREKRSEILEQLEVKSEYWKQRVKSKWDQAGDKTSAFFYKSVKGRSAINGIKAIRDSEGTWTTDQSTIQKLFQDSFKDLFMRNNSLGEKISVQDPFLSPISFLTQNHIDILNLPFTREEIKSACFSSTHSNLQALMGLPQFSFNKTGIL